VNVAFALLRFDLNKLKIGERSYVNEESYQIILPAGTYTVVDSNPATWSQNGNSRGKGFTAISGSPAGPVTPVDDDVKGRVNLPVKVTHIPVPCSKRGTLHKHFRPSSSPGTAFVRMSPAHVSTSRKDDKFPARNDVNER
jgi:hypothetical protein